MLVDIGALRVKRVGTFRHFLRPIDGWFHTYLVNYFCGFLTVMDKSGRIAG